MGAKTHTVRQGTDAVLDALTANTATLGGRTVNSSGQINNGWQVQILTASGAITVKSGQVQLNHATVAVAATLAAPTAGDRLLIVDNSASGTAAHTVTLPAGVTWDGTNNTATLNAPGEALLVEALSATRWFIITNIGSVALTTV